MSNNPSVPRRPVVTQEWSLHAELTFSHQGPTSASQSDPKGRMHMQYLWDGQPEQSATTRHTLHPCYGFQRGNILFTTTPPSRNTQNNLTCSPISKPSTSVPHQPTQDSPLPHPDSISMRNSQPYNRRCKSTCSIILSGEHAPFPKASSVAGSEERGRSCSPVTRCYHTLTHRCGDPVCYHSSPTDPTTTIPESCEVCGGGRSPTAVRRAARANTFTTHFCTRVPERTPATGSSEKKTEKESKDAAIQTTDIVPVDVSKMDNTSHTPPETFVRKSKVVKKSSHSSTKSKNHSSSLQRGDLPANAKASSPGAESSPHKPRTVHIDVYCTGSEDADADSSNTDTDSVEDGESWSSPQTVFESDKLRVVHKRASKNQLPQALQHQVSQTKSDISEHPPPEFDSDDGLTSLYPSKDSSYATFRDADSSLQSGSRDASWSTLASSVGYDSSTATSWKDTATEIDSLAQSNISLTQSDSFEYADAIDRLRIREKERAWAGVDVTDQSKTWQCPQSERKLLLQQQKLKEYVEKHLGKAGFPLWKPVSCEDSEDDEDETGDTWCFGDEPSSPKVSTIRRESHKSGKDIQSTPIPSVGGKSETSSMISLRSNTPHLLGDSGSLSDSGPTYCRKFTCRDVIGPFGSKTPSPPPVKLESTVTVPFTSVLGRRTEQLLKAQKFGTIVGAFRKPGHHVGPSKNPDCSCVHCREYYEGSGHRGRARSVGEMPLGRHTGRINL